MANPSQADDRARIARPRLWVELLGGLLLFALYVVVDGLGGAARTAAAQRNGHDVLEAERALYIPVEEWLNDWLAGHPSLQLAANYEYAFTYIASALALLIWLYAYRPHTYRWARNSFVVMNLIAIACFVLYPCAPPRLLPDEHFFDTVLQGHTWGSWGSPLVKQANQLAAMPSLHIGWALWVSIVLACISGARWLQWTSAGHVLLTALVVMATANHYVLDVVAGAVLVWITVAIMAIFTDRPGQTGGERLSPADVFFLYAESDAWPQHVGGLIVMDDDPADPYQDRLRAALRRNLDSLPRFRQRLHLRSAWRRPRWQDVGDLDWDWHTPFVDLGSSDRAGLDDYVARVQQEKLPRDRPMWRYITVTGFAEGKVALVLVVHHCVADGIATIEQALHIIEPKPPGLGRMPPQPPAWRRGLAVAAGLARLATDGSSGPRLPSSDAVDRAFHSFHTPLEELRSIALQHEVRLTDVLLSMTAGSLRRVLGDAAPATLRVTTPLMVRPADSSADGNLTAAVMTTVPLGAMSETERLLEVGRIARRTERGTRALASRFVMTTVATLLPPPVHAWFARTVYGFRFFQAIVTNMPGPTGVHTMAGGLMREVVPIIPLAPRVPIAVGALSWSGTVCIGYTVGPDLIADAQKLADAAQDILAELAGVGPPPAQPPPPDLPDVTGTAAANRAPG